MLRHIAATAVVTLAISTHAFAQEDANRLRPSVSLSYGLFQFDLSGTGDSRMWAARVEKPLNRFLLAEGGVLFARPGQQFGDTTTFVVPEVQLQGQLPLGPVAPYIGGGLGMAFDLRDDQAGGTQSDVTLSVAGGLRAWFTQVLGARAELRVRGIGSRFTGSAAEWTLGAALRF
jgi:hypothetical protein